VEPDYVSQDTLFASYGSEQSSEFSSLDLNINKDAHGIIRNAEVILMKFHEKSHYFGKWEQNYNETAVAITSIVPDDGPMWPKHVVLE
jgi:hypothetical protein